MGKCNKRNLRMANTTFAPKKGGEEKLVTWMSRDGGVQRQLGYLISGKRQNWVKETGKRTGKYKYKGPT